MHKLKLFLITVLIISFAGIQQIVAETNDIIIYSSTSCGWTKEMISFLETNKIQYIFKDLDNENNHREMTDAVEKAFYKSDYSYPVMNIKGQIVMRPALKDVKKALSGEIIHGLEQRFYKDANWRIGYPKSMQYSLSDVYNRIKEGDVTIYDNKSSAGKKLITALNKEKIPYKLVTVNPADKSFRAMLDKNGFGKKIVMPVADVKNIMIMDATGNCVVLMLIQLLGD